jgi:protein TonB
MRRTENERLEHEAALNIRIAAVLALAGVTGLLLLAAGSNPVHSAVRSSVQPLRLLEVSPVLLSPPRPENEPRRIHSAVPIPDPQGGETDPGLTSYIPGLDTAVIRTEIEPPIAYFKVERPPVLLRMPQPDYPEVCRAAGIEGRVVLHIVVGVNGAVDSVAVYLSSGNRMLDESAVSAVRGAEFRAGVQRDRPVRVIMAVPVDFRLN